VAGSRIDEEHLLLDPDLAHVTHPSTLRADGV
jgi:hypothetical protein